MATPKLKDLHEKRKAINARIQRELTKQKTLERREDTRRKVLAGATILEWAKRDGDIAERLRLELQTFLVRDNDRALFGLPPAAAKK